MLFRSLWYFYQTYTVLKPSDCWKVYSSFYNLPKWHSHSSEDEISTCRKCWSVAQPLFRGGNYNLLKYQLHSHSSEVFLGCNYNLPKYCQLHSHSSEVFLSCNYNLLKCWSNAQPLPISPPPHCQPTGGHLNLSCRPTGNYLNLPCWPTHYPINPTVGRPISPPIPLSANWLLLELASRL